MLITSIETPIFRDDFKIACLNSNIWSWRYWAIIHRQISTFSYFSKVLEGVMFNSRMIFFILSCLMFKYGVIRFWNPKGGGRWGSVMKLWVFWRWLRMVFGVFSRPCGRPHPKTTCLFSKNYWASVI